ncbi:TIGR04388 family protein, partial [Leptospira kmetyi]|uniref:TIGR04388 family protein n=1 Tax=Leptospira kmetyi TaxID=408139 RepID=UPI0010824F3A
QVGQLLKYYQDKKTAKEAAKDQKLKDAGQVVAVAAAAALTYLTAGSTAPLLETLLAAAPEIATVTAVNVGTQVYIAGETGGGQNGSIAAAVNGVVTTLTAGSNSAVSGYVSWTPHRAGNLITGEDAVKGGWGGGVTFGMKGTGGLLKDVGLNGTLSFQPGSGIGVNLNVVPPGSAGMPNGTFFGISYQSGSGDYTASGGFALGKSGLGLAISASKDGYASLGLNYSKEGKSLQNYFSGGSLNI